MASIKIKVSLNYCHNLDNIHSHKISDMMCVIGNNVNNSNYNDEYNEKQLLY
jgi:hypothetical protein